MQLWQESHHMMIGSYCESTLDIVAEACERVVKEKVIFDSF